MHYKINGKLLADITAVITRFMVFLWDTFTYNNQIIQLPCLHDLTQHIITYHKISCTLYVYGRHENAYKGRAWNTIFLYRKRLFRCWNSRNYKLKSTYIGFYIELRYVFNFCWIFYFFTLVSETFLKNF